jgi:hypothetical protein
MSDTSTNALLMGPAIQPPLDTKKFEEAGKQVLSTIDGFNKTIKSFEDFFAGIKKIFDLLKDMPGLKKIPETIEKAADKLGLGFKNESNGIKDIKLSIDCDSLRNAVQKCLSKECFKICCKCNCGSSRSSSGNSMGSSKSTSESSSGTGGFSLSGWLGQTIGANLIGQVLNYVGSNVGSKIGKGLEKVRPKNKKSVVGSSSNSGYLKDEGYGSLNWDGTNSEKSSNKKSSKSRFGSLKTGMGKIGGSFKGGLGKAGGLLKGGLSKGAGILGKVGGLGLRALGPIGLAVSGGMAAFDGYNKWNELKGKGASNWTALKGAAWAGLDSFTMGGASAVAGMIPQSWKNTAGNMLGGVDKALGGIVNNPGQITKSISNLVNQAVSALRSLPGRAASAVMGLGGRIGGMISKAMNTAGKYVTNGINQIVKFFRLLPGRAAGAIGGLLGAIGGRISGALNYARSIVSSGITAVVGFFMSLPGRAASAVGGLLGAIGGRISGALSYAQSIVSGGVNAIINAFWTLPGRVSAALSSMYNTVVSWINSTLGPLKSLYCMIAGCSPGIIPAFKSMAQEVPKQIGSTMPHIEKFANSLNKIPSNVKIDAAGSGNSTTGSSHGNVVVQKGAIVIEGPVYGITDLEKKMEKVTLNVLDRESTFY